MLKLEQVSVRLGNQQALAGIDFSLAPGELVGILGANGAGKSTLLGVLAGDISPQRGTSTLNQRSLTDYSVAALARIRAMLPQKSTVTFDLSVAEIVAMGAYPWPEISPARLAKLIDHCLQETDTHHLRERRFPSLSGGETLRVQFARLLLQIFAGPSETDRYLLLDEPMANLDPRHQVQILETVLLLSRQHHTGVAITLHDVNLASRWCDRLVLLREGQIVASGKPSDVLTSTILESVYDTPASCLPHPLQPEKVLVLFDRKNGLK